MTLDSKIEIKMLILESSASSYQSFIIRAPFFDSEQWGKSDYVPVIVYAGISIVCWEICNPDWACIRLQDMETSTTCTMPWAGGLSLCRDCWHFSRKHVWPLCGSLDQGLICPEVSGITNVLSASLMQQLQSEQVREMAALGNVLRNRLNFSKVWFSVKVKKMKRDKKNGNDDISPKGSSKRVSSRTRWGVGFLVP